MTFVQNPEVAAALADLMGDAVPQPATTPHEIRAAVAATYPVLTARLPVQPVTERTFTATTADGGELRLGWFAPADRAGNPSAAVVHAHGGGMIAGSVETLAPFVREYVGASGVPFLSVEYRLAPESTGTTLAEDVYTGLTWLHEHAAELGVDPARIALMGESAGAGLAAGAAILARDNGVAVARQILVYPMLDDSNVDPDPFLDGIATWSYRDNRLGWDALLGERRGGADVPAVAAPARLTDFTGIAPAYLEVGALDIFRDETIAYACGLLAAGIDAELHVLPGLVHGWDHYAIGSTIRTRVMRFRIDAITSL
ncbi:MULTISPECIES: alpha/beta hydrolase [Catenuloplanes]|uniref:Acetyl esterase/lipase n=1 Tax=Catenuloplanes niger TaxID=587534 RepID=A0AAE3ZQT3_9ACTN|nr:alpha/beta hydrolase [Catenuloplanes niger]MDR7324379.1 acetyl esterase/lipase [Catenuloplanes niger]